MALVFAVASLKGGVGKSTLTINLAEVLHRAGHRTLIVDADSQGTCRQWAAVAADAELDGPPVVALEGKTLRRDLSKVSAGFDCVVVDTPPRLGAEVRASMLMADLVLMPVIPGAADVWALKETSTVLEEARDMRPELKAAIVLNRTARTTLAGVTKSAVGELGIPVLSATLSDRVAYGEATARGQGVTGYEPGGKAASEVEALTRAVLEALRDN